MRPKCRFAKRLGDVISHPFIRVSRPIKGLVTVLYSLKEKGKYGFEGIQVARLCEHGTHHRTTADTLHGKAKFLESMRGLAHETTRGLLTINVYGDTTVIFGEQRNRTAKADGSISTNSLMATQKSAE